MTDQEYSIQDLCDQTGLPRRTIHFYTQQEIIPPPFSSGLGARYQRIHLVRLHLIPILRQQGLRLDDIRQKFSAATPDELANMLANLHNLPNIPKRTPKPIPDAVRAIVPQTYQVYNLPHGVIVMAPDHLSKALLTKIENFHRDLEQEYTGSSR